MSTVSLSGDNLAQRTFAAVMSVLGVVAAVQIFAALYFATRSHEEPLTPRRQAIEKRLFQHPQLAATPAAKPVKLPAVVGVPPATVRPVQPPPASVPETLLELAKNFRAHGDTTNAIAKLQQATSLAPANPEILAELALTYESMQLFDRSNEVWHRLESLGRAAGPLYDLAELKLRVGVPEQKESTAAAAVTQPAAGTVTNDSDIPEGSIFGFSEVSLRRENDPEVDTRLLLRVGVKARPDTPIDYTKVKIQVFFYDTVNDDQVVLTNADVSYEWVTPGHNWADTGTEILDVTYLRPKRSELPPGTVAPAEAPDSVEKAHLAAREAENPDEPSPPESGPRQFLGYIVRVYYRDQLQAARADPKRLLDLFPPPISTPQQ
jgi:tetratricopeptide (TPR) repeat protein